MTAEHPQQETRTFETEVQQLLHLMVHALYSHREIFLRELISNASDAIDKLRFEGLKNEELFEGQKEGRIRLVPDSEAGTLTIIDNGIGMDRDEVVENLGTIAHSGSRAFVDRLTGDEDQDVELIGQFGVGFYSAFMVADRVEVTTRRAGVDTSLGVRWESDGTGSYTVETIERAELGTAITLHLKDDAREFLEEAELRRVVKTYSDHIPYPVVLEGGEGEETLNEASALWARPRNEISEEEYRNFYAHVAHGDTDPLTWLHFHAEGTTEYTALLYLPSQPPLDLWQPEARHGVRLYVRRVFITDQARDLLPTYLRFLRGVVDAPDLPLNVSREMLQSDQQVARIRKGVVKRVLKRLADMAENEPDRYRKFWDNFGAVLKEGIPEDSANQDELAGLLRFHTSKRPDEWVSLADYKAAMRDEQKAIYYLTGDDLETLKNSPQLEVFKKKGVEVLLLTDPVDEWVVMHLSEYDGTPLTSVAHGDLDLGELESEEEKQVEEATEADYGSLVGTLKDRLGEAVSDVRLSHRLTDSPSCIVAGENALGEHMERLLKAANQPVPESQPILEVNPDHPLVQTMKEIHGTDPADKRLGEWGWLLLDQARLAQGAPLPDPAATARRLSEVMNDLAGSGPSRIIT
ncbi:molecular chaperone HtpG [Thiohalorhabdus denitrificans]|uniref:Chaperone protein HtpG n=1 Tax=Thiohalorhabdus denitrificans TaxID=381306 RepID=A0A1G5AHH1_9GAMM|nr:molecular chaperone HtpG [Thiohalorhabdus denitrificans]